MTLSRMLRSLNVTIPTPLGVPLVFHWTWLLLWALISVGGLYGFVLLPSLFLIVILHEFGHCYAAQRFGMYIQNILILPIGGCAQIDLGMPEPKKEFVVTAAGPLVNVVLLAPLFILSYFCRGTFAEGYTGTMASLNLFMLGFNLLPAFPMDGGRLFRAALQYQTGDMLKATKIAVRVGHVVAAVGAVIAFYHSLYMTVVLAWFIAMAGLAEIHRLERMLGVVRDDDEPEPPPAKVTVTFVSWTPPERESA